MSRFGGRYEETFAQRLAAAWKKNPLAIGISTGLVAFCIISMGIISLSSFSPKDEKSQDNMEFVSVFVIDSELPAKTEITQSMVRQVAYPKPNVPENAVLEIDKIIGRFSSSKIKTGIITSAMLAEKSEEVKLPIAPGTFALTVSVGEAESMEKNLLPGTRADLLAINKEKGYRDILMQSVPVLVNSGSVKDPKVLNSTPKESQRLVTVAVPKDIALEVIAATLEKDLRILPTGSDAVEIQSEAEKQAMGFNKDVAAKPDCSRGVRRIDGVKYCLDKKGNLVRADG